MEIDNDCKRKNEEFDDYGNYKKVKYNTFLDKVIHDFRLDIGIFESEIVKSVKKIIIYLILLYPFQ